VSNPLAPSPVPVTLVHSAACHFCDDARSALDALALDYAIEVTQIDLESADGAALVALHRPPLNPLVLIDGAYFSAGRLPRRKLVKLLEQRGAALAISALAVPALAVPALAIPTGTR
jgi:hypothetical protein